MIRHRTLDEIRRFDLFKIVVLALLIVLGLVLTIRARRAAESAPPTAINAAASPVVVTVVVTAPSSPQPTASPVQPMAAPSLISPLPGSEINPGAMTMIGSGEPNSNVKISVDGSVVGAAPVDGNGRWSFTVVLDTPGTHILNMQTVDSGGAAASASVPATLSVAAPTVAINSPTVQFSLSDGRLVLTGSSQPDSEVQVVVDGAVASTAHAGADGGWTSAITLTPGQHDLSVRAIDAVGGVLSESEPVTLVLAPTIISPTERAELPKGPLTLTGAGEPGTEIEVLDKGEVIGQAQVGANGGWSFALTPTEGAHEFSVRPAGNAVATSNIIHVVVGSSPTVAAATPTGATCTGGPGIQIGQSYLVGPCDTLTFISKRTGISLQALLAANPQIKNPDLILIGQTIRLP